MSSTLSASLPDTRESERWWIAAACAAVAVLGIMLVHPHSLLHFSWYFCLWCGLAFLLHREDSARFTFAFLVNSAFIAVYVYLESTIYPDTYGTTSPRSVSWTDDSYFFSLIADDFPKDLLTRVNYYQYTHTFSSLIRVVTPWYVDHPLDTIFFQSGIAAMLSTFTAKLAFQLSGDQRLSRITFLFVLVCPFLMMNGGVVLLRDTFAAALLVYSICCINSRQFVLAGAAIAWQLALRPGTGLILLPGYAVFYFREVRAFVGRYPLLFAAGITISTVTLVILAPAIIEFVESKYGVQKISFLGRELISDLTADPDANGIFLAVQEMPFIVKLFLNGLYIFLYPFLTLRTVFAEDDFDIRNITLSIVIPVYSFWLNAWFIAGALSARKVMDRQREIVVALAVILMLVGIYSLQSRHKTIIYPLYYLLIAAGFTGATPTARRIGYIFSGMFALVEIASVMR